MFLASQRLFLASQRREELERPITATEAAARIAIRYEAYVAGRYEYRPSSTADHLGTIWFRDRNRCRTRDRSRTRSRSSRSPQPCPRRSPRRRMPAQQRLTGSLKTWKQWRWERQWRRQRQVTVIGHQHHGGSAGLRDGHPSLAARVPRLAELA